MKSILLRFVAGAAILVACAPSLVAQVTAVPGDPLTGSGSVTRTLLTYSTLMTSSTSSAPVNDSAYALPTGAAPPTDNFQGTLTLTSPTSNGTFSDIYDPDNYKNANSQWQHLPAFSFQFVQNGSYFIPVSQGWQLTGSSYWNIILGVGRAWTESGDSGYTRVSMPFSLVEYNQNCVHQGELTFLFSNTLSPNISYVNYQITYETCEYWHFNLWGTIAATYTPSTISNATTLENAEAAEITNRIPVKPFSSIATDFPNSGFNASNITSQFAYSSDIATYGIYINGTNYVAGCTTRYGTYAFCSEMRFPSYSLAKSVFVGMGLMKLGQDYGTGVYSQLIKTWLPSYYTQGGTWTNVTFANTSDMATGNYTSSGFETDENGTVENTDVINVVPFVTKIDNSFKYFSNQTTPGTTWVYHTHDAFILTSAMQKYLQGQTTSSADMNTYLATNVYAPLNLSAGAMNIMRTDNLASATSTTGYPIGSYGMFFNQDDIIKLANFMNQGTGVINGTTVIDPNRLQETMFRTSRAGFVLPDSGFTDTVSGGSPSLANTNHYLDDIWEVTYTPTNYSTLTCSFNAPYFSGYGGNTVVLLPNGVIYYMFGDGGEFWQDNAVVEISKLQPICPTAVSVGANSLNFNSTTITPVTQTVVLTNPNTELATLAVPSISGTNASLFSANNPCSSIAASSTCTITVTFTPTATGSFSATLTIPTGNNYTVGTTVTPNSTATVTLYGYVGPARTTPTITWATPSPITYGTALSATQLNASTSIAGSFSYSPPSGTVLTAGMQTLYTTFTPTDTTDYNNATQMVALTVNQATPTISWTPSATSIGTGVAIGTGILDANSTTAGSITYTATPSGGTASAVTSTSTLTAGTYTLTATLTPTDTTDYTTAISTKTLAVKTSNIWIINNAGTIAEMGSGGTAITSSALTGGAVSIAIDSSGNVWTANGTADTIAEHSKTGAVTSSGYGNGTSNTPASLAVDGLGNIWVANSNGSVSELNNAGTLLSPTGGFVGGSMSTPAGVAIDISGNVWVSNNGNSSVTEIIGGAAPVAPLTVSTQSTTLGTRP
jgi:hypothetical protein